MIRPEIQALLDKTQLPTVVPTAQQIKSFKIAAVGELQRPYEWFFSHYRTDVARPFLGRTETMRIEWFGDTPVPISFLQIDGCVVIVHNHLSDRPCFANDGCKRVR